MPSPIKKYVIIFLVLTLSLSTCWIFYSFSFHWGIAIENEQEWHSGFQKKNSIGLSNIKWNADRITKKELKQNKEQNIVFQNKFALRDYTRLKEGFLEYDFRYSAKILINGVAFSNINRNLISPTTENGKVVITEYSRPRKVKLNHEFLNHHLKNGENTITIIVYNVKDLKWVDYKNKQLSFLDKGQRNNLKTASKTQALNNYFTQSQLPIFKINTFNRVIPDEPKIRADLTVANDTNKINQLIDSNFAFNIKIERRGRSSQSFAKKSYSFKLYNNRGKSQAVKLIGLPSSKKWVLYGPFADKSLIRNALAYSLYSQMGHYAPRFKFISLVINDNYQGIYMLTEKIQISPNHLNIPYLKIDRIDSTKFKGGYILDIDRYLHLGASNYPPTQDSSAHPVCYQLYQPKSINQLAKERVDTQFEIFQQHLYEKNNIFDYIDLNSFIDHLLITELSKNIDGYRLSTFLYNKNINSNVPKFYLGPIWDYNFSFGLANYKDGFRPKGYIYNADKFVPFWWKILLTDPFFSSTLKARYYELRKKTFSNNNINSTIDQLYEPCKIDAENNFKKWPVLNSSNLWPNYYMGETYKDEILYLKEWINKRLSFLDNDILGKDMIHYETAIGNDIE